MKSNKKILITGPTSYVGRSFLRSIAKKHNKRQVLCFIWNKDTPAGVENRKIIEKLKLPTKKIDLVTKEGLNNLPKDPGLVIHMAANTDTSVKNHRVNDIGTKNLIRALGKLSSNTHVIYTSTTVFYGGRPDCSVPLTEESKPYPTNEYGRTKLKAEKLLIEECKKQKFRLTVLRLNTVYGPDPRPKSLFKIIPKMVRRKAIYTRLNWPGLTSIVHVDDVVKAIYTVATQKKPRPGKPDVYILHGQNLTLADISREIHKVLKIPYRPILLPKTFWRIGSQGRKLVPYIETLLPQRFYNPFWRASLVVDDAVYCTGEKAQKNLPDWHPIQLKDVIKEVVFNKKM